MIIEAFQRWQFRRGFRAGHRDAWHKQARSVAPGSAYATGYRLGVACYALALDFGPAMEAAERGAFSEGKF